MFLPLNLQFAESFMKKVPRSTPKHSTTEFATSFLEEVQEKVRFSTP